MKILTKLLFTCLMFFCVQAVFAASAPSPAGYWRTIDDVTGQAKSIVRISIKGGQLFGQVVKLYPRPGMLEVCEACQGSMRNKPIRGMTVMYNLKQSSKDPSVWDKGSILDPKNGKVYHCYVQISPSGNELNVRGYVGMPLFGRTQTWQRVSGPNS